MAKQKGITLQRFSGAEFAAALATALQDPNGMAYYVYVDDETGQLVFPAPPSPTMPIGQVDSAGRVRQGNATGSMPVVEDNSNGINLNASYIMNALRHDRNHPLFGVSPSPAATYWDNAASRVLAANATATAGGELTATTLVPALASYTGYCYISGVWSDQTDAGAACTITGGVPAALNVVTTADTLVEIGIWLQGAADNTAITIAAAAGQFGANQVLQFQGTYHYET